MLKVLGGVLLAVLLVLVGMNFLIVSNVGDRLRALQVEVDQLKGRPASVPGPDDAAAARVPFDVETAPPLAGETSNAADGPLVTLSDRPIREATVALVETIPADGAPMPVLANAVVLLPGVPGMIPLGRDAGCLPGPAGGAWILTLEGGAVRIASRGCAYPRPLRGRLRGVLAR